MILQKKKLNTKNSLLPLFFILFIFLISINLQFYTLDKNEIVIENDTLSENLKIATNSGRIVIANNWSDAVASGVCSGSGTFTDPYIIQDFVIDGHGSGSGIKITLSRNYFFRIENCTIFNCSIGIELYSTNNGTLYQNNCSFNGDGIYLHCPVHPTPETYGCYNNTIIGNTANNNHYGIHLDHFVSGKIINNTANNNNMGIFHNGYPYIISGNTVNNNGYSGISLWGPGSNSEISGNIAIDNKNYGIYMRSHGFNLTRNVMVGSGIAISSEVSIERMSQISVDTTNLVNNKPMYYLINKTDIYPPNLVDAGQIFLINCTNILVKDIDVSNSTLGINIYASNNITVLNAISSNNSYGIYLKNTNNSFILYNTLKYNKYGIYFISGLNNTVEGNYIYNNFYNTMEGLTFDFYDDHNQIINNEIIGCVNGIKFRLSSYNVISGNIIRDNYYGILVMGGSEHNLFYENYFTGNQLHVDGGSTTNKWNSTDIGNYWDNYTGIDADNNGIGDTPHIISQNPLIQDFLPIVITENPPSSEFIPGYNLLLLLMSAFILSLIIVKANLGRVLIRKNVKSKVLFLKYQN